MKLPDVLKKGILEGDWDLICKVYTGITGEPIEPPKPKEPDWANIDIDLGVEDDWAITHPKVPVITYVDETGLPGIAVKIDETPGDAKLVPGTQIKDVADDATEKALIEDDWVEEDDSNFTGEADGAQARREQVEIVENRENKFIDNTGVYKKERVDINPMMGAPQREVEPEKKRKTGLVKVQCSICDKKEEVSRALASKYNKDPEKNTYRCNTCCSSRS
jgi:hypothetical protein